MCSLLCVKNRPLLRVLVYILVAPFSSLSSPTGKRCCFRLVHVLLVLLLTSIDIPGNNIIRTLAPLCSVQSVHAPRLTTRRTNRHWQVLHRLGPVQEHRRRDSVLRLGASVQGRFYRMQQAVGGGDAAGPTSPRRRCLARRDVQRGYVQNHQTTTNMSKGYNYSSRKDTMSYSMGVRV